MLGEMRLPKDSATGRREYERQLETRRQQESGDQEWAAIRRGWFFGTDELKQELLAHAAERVGAQHYGAERLHMGVWTHVSNLLRAAPKGDRSRSVKGED